MKIHDEIGDWSAGALCDALSPEERVQFERHLAECPRCRSLHEEDSKMNETLNEAMAEVRPDANFERRIIDGVRGKIARPWWMQQIGPIDLHPLRGLAWLMRFRIAQAAAALLILAAMIEAGRMISGEQSPGSKLAANAQAGQQFPDMKPVPNVPQGANTILTINASGTNVTRDTGVNLNSASPSLAAATFSGLSSNYVINSLNITGTGAIQTGANTTISGSLTDTRAIGAGSTLQLGNGHTDGVNSSWATGSNWGDTAHNIGAAGAPGVSGALSVGDTATFSEGADSLRITNNSGLGFGGTVFNTASPVAVDVNGQNVTFATGIGAPQANNSVGIVKAGTGTLVLGGANTYAGATTLNSGTLISQNATDSGVVSTGGVLQTRAAPGDVGALAFGPTTILSGTLAQSSGVIVGGNQTWALNSTSNAPLTVNGQISGGHAIASIGIQKSGPGTIGGSVAVNSGSYNGNWTFKPGGPPSAGNILPKVMDNVVLSGSNNVQGGKSNLPAPVPAPAPVIDTRKLIRNAALDFEVASFEKALDTITAVAGEEQGYVFSQNSAKGANGKLQGQVIVKVMPGNLDRFLLKLRALGDIKNQTVSALDVSKDYYDTESRIRNSQVTEARLIDMMKTRTGKVSDLLEVENEIARVRGEIEQMQGQLKLYDAQVQFATVSITLQEKDINQTAAYLLTQQAQLAVFSKDVEKAFSDAKSDASDAKAQTVESHVERDAAGHVVATLHLLIPPESADEAIVKLKEIGRIQHFNSQTQRVARDNSGDTNPSDTAKVDRDKVDLTMIIQQDAENPVQGTNISVQTDQVEAKSAEIKKEAAKEGVEVKGAEFNRMRNGVEISAMLLRMPMWKYNAFIEQIKALGTVKDFTVARREDSTATDDAPVEIVLQIFNQGNIVGPEAAATARNGIGEGVAALAWSVRMIGVTLAFIAPWAVIAGLVGWIAVMRRRRKARKQG